MTEMRETLAEILGEHFGFSTVIDRTAHKAVDAVLEALRTPTTERLLKLTVEQEDGAKYEVLAPTLDGGKTIAGVIETVLTFSGNFSKMPDYVTVNGERYVPADAR